MYSILISFRRKGTLLGKLCCLSLSIHEHLNLFWSIISLIKPITLKYIILKKSCMGTHPWQTHKFNLSKKLFFSFFILRGLYYTSNRYYTIFVLLLDNIKSKCVAWLVSKSECYGVKYLNVDKPFTEGHTLFYWIYLHRIRNHTSNVNFIRGVAAIVVSCTYH